MNDPCLEIAELFRRHQTFLVLTHYRPDGDAIGSQLALALVLKDLGKQVEVWNDDVVPTKFKFLPHAKLITRPPAQPKAFDVVISIDASNWQRVGTAADKIASKKHFINIDHHVSNDKFAEINWIVTSAPASGQIAFDLIKRGGFKLTPEIAQCLYAAISTDTGSFMFGNTTAECLRVAAELVETGINVGELTRHVYESYPFARLRMLQMALADLKLTDHKHTAYFWVTKDMFANSGAKREDTEGLIDFARAIEGVVVAVLFEEMEEAGKIRISLRSKHPKLDVNSIARHFGGGGHKEAAGARLTGTPQEVEPKVLATISAALQHAGIQRMLPTFTPYDGVLLVDKPAGITSHDVVDRLRRNFGFNKVGHCGTLDPQATGLLLIVLERATKLQNNLMIEDKVYEGTMLLGIATDSQDADGKVLAEKPVPALTEADLEAVMTKFRGDIQQIPPMVSAKKIAGQPLYKLARKGKTIEREPRLVHIYDFRLLKFDLPRIEFRLACTKGTYVRTICADIGDLLGCGAHLSVLRRTASGKFDVKNAKTLDELLTLKRDQLVPHIIPILTLAKQL